MGKSAPKPPDPYATAAAQGQINQQTAAQQSVLNAETARLNARLNRGTTTTPYGTVSSRDLGAEWMDNRVAQDQQAHRDQGKTYAGEENARKFFADQNPNADRWETTTTLSPDQQRLFDNQTRLSSETQRMALDQLPRLEGLLDRPLDVSGAQAWQGLGNNDFSGDRQRVEEAIMSRLEPQFARDRDGLEGRLISQGFNPASEGYGRAADELGRARTDARMQAVLAGGQEQSRLFGMDAQRAGFNNNMRQGQISEALQLRAQPLNELSAIFGLGPGVQAPQAAQLAPTQAGNTGIDAPNLAGMIQQNYQTQAQNVAGQNAAMGQLFGSVIGAGGSWARGGFANPFGGSKK